MIVLSETVLVLVIESPIGRHGQAVRRECNLNRLDWRVFRSGFITAERMATDGPPSLNYFVYFAPFVVLIPAWVGTAGDHSTWNQENYK